MFWSIIGFLAAGLTMFSFIPQIIKIIKTKSACDVSVLTLTQLSIGVSLWIIYGIHLKNFIIIMANAVTLATLITALWLCSVYKK
jgi:MtN3 and saliva related transmembrane protein